MEALYLLVPFSVVIVFVAIWVFFLASDSGQFDDMIGPAMRVLQDDDRLQQEGAAPEQNPAGPAPPSAQVIPFRSGRLPGWGPDNDEVRTGRG